MPPKHPGTPVDVYVRVTFDIDTVTGPAFIRVQMTPEWLELLSRRMAACEELQFKFARAEFSPTYVDSSTSEVTIRRWSLEVDANAFRFIGEARNEGNSVSRWIGLGELGQALSFQADPNSGQVPDGFGWYGEALFYVEDEDVGFFIDEVCNALPEVDAKETALKMAEAISETSDDKAPTTGASLARQRRMGI
jgi:hypothetical protein